VRFLIDANLPRSLAELVKKLGHDVQFARDIGLGTVSSTVVSVASATSNAPVRPLIASKISSYEDGLDQRLHLLEPQQLGSIVMENEALLLRIKAQVAHCLLRHCGRVDRPVRAEEEVLDSNFSDRPDQFWSDR
jgi:hypothetical protein